MALRQYWKAGAQIEHRKKTIGYQGRAGGGRIAFGQSAIAAENGVGFYLLGTKGPLAAVLPEPGLYLQNDTYYYNASAGASEKLPVGGTIGIGLRANAIVNMPTLLWSTPYEPGGGRLAFAMTRT